MPVGDWLELAFADVVFDVEDQDPAWLKHTPAFGPGFKVKGAVGVAPLELAGVARAERPAERVAIGVARAVVAGLRDGLQAGWRRSGWCRWR